MGIYSLPKMSEGGIVARRLKIPPGLVKVDGRREHTVSVHLGAPVRATCTRGGRSYVSLVMPGDVEIVPAGEVAQWEDEQTADVLSMRLEPTLVSAVAAQLNSSGRGCEVLPRIRIRDAEIAHLANAVASALSSGEPTESLMIQSLGVAIAACVVRRHCSIVEGFGERRLSQRQFSAVCEFIESNLSRPLCLDDLAAVAGLSTSHFKTLFKAAAGITPHAYVLRRRVARASNLIKSGSSPLSEIALEVGFADQSHMARVMRRELGITPGTLARSC